MLELIVIHVSFQGAFKLKGEAKSVHLCNVYKFCKLWFAMVWETKSHLKKKKQNPVWCEGNGKFLSCHLY